MPKGKKICPGCGIENGVRTSICRCGHRFLSKKEATEDKPRPALDSFDIKHSSSSDEEAQRPNVSRVFSSSISCPLIQTPAGRCPIRPQGFSRNDWPDGPAPDDVIESWAVKVFSSGNYLPDAVVYWIHEFWDMNLNYGSEYKRVKRIVLRTLCGEDKEIL